MKISTMLAAGVIGGGKMFLQSLPVQYGDEAFVNEGFETWSDANTPANWTKATAGTSSVNREGTEQLAGTYCARMDIDASASACSLSATGDVNVVAGTWYKMTVYSKTNIGSRGFSMNLQLGTGDQAVIPGITWAKTELIQLCASNSTVYPLVKRTPGQATYSVYFDQMSYKPIVFASTLASSKAKTTATGDFDISFRVTVPSGAQGGIAANLVSAATALTNGVFFYADRNGSATLKLVKYVAGTRTQVASTAITYAANSLYRLVKTGTTYQMYIDGAQVGTDQTIDDATVIDNTQHMQWATSSEVTYSFFTVGSMTYRRIAWISDVHAGDARWETGELDAMFANIESQSPDLVIGTGDLINEATTAQRDIFTTAAAALSADTEWLNGNHEYPLNPWQSSFTADVGPIRLIAFQGGEPHLLEADEIAVDVDAPTLAAVEADLQAAAAAGKIPVLVSHHSIDSHIWGYIRTGATELKALCSTYGVKAALSGHAHLETLPINEDGITSHVSGPAALPTADTPPGWSRYCLIDVYQDRMKIFMYRSVAPFAFVTSKTVML